MYRLAALAGLTFVLTTGAVQGAEETLPASDRAEATVSAPANVQLAQLKPTLSDMPDAVEPVVLHVRPVRKGLPMATRFAPGPRLVTKVDISDQTMNVFLDGELVHTWKVSTAGRGYITPTGSWKPYRMHTMWHSRKYDNAPMPHSIFYDGGYAIHATPHVKRLGKPASHGCVRLHPENAKVLFQMAKDVGRDFMQVVVRN